MSSFFVDFSSEPTSKEGFYATNNQFLKEGPKGFHHITILPSNNLFVRVDVPGVPTGGIQYRVDSVWRKVVIFSGKEAATNYDDDGRRSYSGFAGFSCDCCEIGGVDVRVKDGIMGIFLKRVKVKEGGDDKFCNQTRPPFSGTSGSCLEDNPFVKQGCKRALYAKGTPGGCLYVRIDVPGASAEDVKLFICGNELRFFAETNKTIQHDESGRVYFGSIEYRKCSPDRSNIKWICRNGVLRILVLPPNTGSSSSSDLISPSDNV